MEKNFKNKLQVEADKATERLESYFKRNFDSPEIIIEAITYSLLGPGKRIRPVLAVETAKALGEDPEKIYPLADALEFIHSYSLIHDDLPAMDDDTLRRGKATNHVVFGEDVAILAGDGLLNLAMERALEGVPKEDPENYIRALKMLFYFSGINGMVGGQTADVLAEKSSTDSTDLEYIQKHKTGAMICASVLCGAVPFLEKDDKRLRNLFNYADAIGTAFQIVDDLLDIEGNPKELGKNTGSDERNNKPTFSSLFGIDACKERIEDLRLKAHEQLEEADIESEFLSELTDYICYRKN